jgi:hypothetical protein
LIRNIIIKYCPYNNTNDELLKFDGVIYKINHDIRIHCLNALKINYINKNNNVTNLSPKQLLKLEEKENKDKNVEIKSSRKNIFYDDFFETPKF